MTGFRLATRIAAREARRRPFRSLLVIALVAIPVMGMTVSTTLIRTDDRTALEKWDDENGHADLRVPLGSEDPDQEANALPAPDTVPTFPAGTKTLEVTTAFGGVRDDQHRAFVELVGTDLADPMWQGRYRTIEGREPMAGGEVSVSRHLADRFGMVVGESFTLVRPDVTFDVVGITEDRECVRCDVFYPAPGATRTLAALGTPFQSQILHVDLPGTPTVDELTALTQSDGVYYEGNVRPLAGIEWFQPESDSTNAIRWSIVIGALVLAVVGIVIAAAFAVGARRQLVLLGQLSANGAPERTLRRVLVLQGTVTGLVGSATGIALGLGALHLGLGQTERFLDRHLNGYRIGLTELAVIAVIGVVGATAAALVPAASAARIPTLHALAGRRPIARVRATLTAGGLVAMLSGLGFLAVATIGAREGGDGNLWAAVAILGGLGVLFGATALTPAMVQRLEPLAGRTRGSLRIASRSLARNRTRTGAVIAAVAAAGALAVGGTSAARAAEIDTEQTRLAASTAIVSDYTFSTHGDRLLRPTSEAVEADLRSALPDATMHRPALVRSQFRLEYPAEPEQYGFAGNAALVVGDELAGAMRLSGDARAALRDEGIVVIRFQDGPDELVSVTFDGRQPMDVDLRFSHHSLGGIAEGVYVSPAFVDRLGLDLSPGPLVATGSRAFTETELFDLQEFAQDQVTLGAFDLRGASTADGRQSDHVVDLQIGRPDTGLDQRRLELLLAAVSVLFALVVVGIGLALAAADEKDEREILTVAGAGPGILSRVAGAKAWVLATLGFALAVPVGYLPAATVISASRTSRALSFPAGVVVTLVLVAPVVAALAALAVTSVTRRVRPVRVSTATFD